MQVAGQGTSGRQEILQTWTIREEERHFPCGLCKTKKKTSRKRESLTADLTQNHAGVSENIKISTDRLTLIIMLSLKLFLL